MAGRTVLFGMEFLILLVLHEGCTEKIQSQTKTGQQTPTLEKTTATGQTQTPTPTQAEALEGYTLEEVSKHNTAADCWLTIDGRVYDVTSFIPMHPGGNAILQGCGKNATELFKTRPMGSGTPHSQDARSLRENYYIGDLK